MSDVTMYATRFCPYCMRARSLFESKGIAYNEIRIDKEPTQRSVMQARSGRTSVPQIFIGDEHIGGSDELHAIERSGELDRLLGAAG